jgi:hypothetical protein
MKLIYKPIGIVLGLIAGFLGKKVFEQLWAVIDELEPPKATTKHASLGKVLGAAAVEGIADPRWGYHGPATSTGGAGVLMIVNGPIARRLDFNCGDNLFGPGWRSNATVGRAVRLVMRNVIGTIPGRLDRGTVGHPGKYTYVIAENEAESPWTPLHAERGCRPEDSAVTVMAALGPHQFYNQLSATAAGVLGTMCDTMRYPGMVGQPNYCVVLAGEHMRTIAADGWSKSDIRKYVFENTTNTIAHLKRTGRMPGAIKPEDETARRSEDEAASGPGGDASSADPPSPNEQRRNP